MDEDKARKLIESKGYHVRPNRQPGKFIGDTTVTFWFVSNGPDGKPTQAFPTLFELAVYLGLTDPECRVIEHAEMLSNAIAKFSRKGRKVDRSRLIDCDRKQYAGLRSGDRVTIYSCRGLNAFADHTETAPAYVKQALADL